jgi:glucokinase
MPPNTLDCLVGDVGGTNARFAIATVAEHEVKLFQPLGLKGADFPRAEDAIDHYLTSVGRERPPAVVIAIAAPIEDQVAVSTNGAWTISAAGLKQHGFAAARLINDFTALVMAAPRLKPADRVMIGPDRALRPLESIAVIGAGTGFGVGALARGFGREAVVATEGGHIGFAPVDDVEIDLLKILARRFGRVSVERILSGPGLVNLRDALAEMHGLTVEALSPEHIVERAKTGLDDLCVETLDRFCAIYGAVAGDLALALGARGGVFLAGGIAPSIIGRLQSGGFRQRFEAKGRFDSYLRPIPTAVIVDPFAALSGAASLALSIQ